jgi:hypothetical protein
MSAAYSATFHIIVSIFLLILAPSITCAASTPLTTQSQPVSLNPSPTANNAEAHPQWLNLLQFRRSDWNKRLQSEVDSPEFFLSDTGKNNPQAELNATIEQLSQHLSLQCRFPARAQWLHQQGMLKNLKITSKDCPDLHQWLAKFKSKSISLIFPAAYLNSPSSMFGHTFLRVDQQSPTDTGQLLAQTINFAANVNHDDPEFLFAYRGLFGGYPGVITVKPYYEKAKEYSEIENRDIWEYRLNFTDEEIERLLLHTWELLPIYFDYYFFDENCAYRVLTLLDVARPSLNLTEQFHSYTIPSDTLRSLNQSNLIEEVHYRPSMATQLKHKVNILPENFHQIALTLAKPGADLNTAEFKNLSPIDQSAILEAAFDYQRYQAQQQQTPRQDAAQHSLTLLKQRSQLPPDSPYPKISEPAIRDDEGHKTFELSVSQGNIDHVETTRLTLRPAYHDLLDPSAGYPDGAQIKFLETALDYRETGTVRVASFTGLNITSLSPRNDFFKPISWRVDAGLYRKYLPDTSDPLTATLNISAGHSYNVGNQKLYALFETQLQHHHSLPSNYSANLGLNIGWLADRNNWQQQLSLIHTNSVVGYNHYYNELSWQLSYHLQPNLSLFGKYQVSNTEGVYFHQHQMGVEWRF